MDNGRRHLIYFHVPWTASTLLYFSRIQVSYAWPIRAIAYNLQSAAADKKKKEISLPHRQDHSKVMQSFTQQRHRHRVAPIMTQSGPVVPHSVACESPHAQMARQTVHWLS